MFCPVTGAHRRITVVNTGNMVFHLFMYWIHMFLFEVSKMCFSKQPSNTTVRQVTSARCQPPKEERHQRQQSMDRINYSNVVSYLALVLFNRVGVSFLGFHLKNKTKRKALNLTDRLDKTAVLSGTRAAARSAAARHIRPLPACISTSRIMEVGILTRGGRP